MLAPTRGLESHEMRPRRLLIAGALLSGAISCLFSTRALAAGSDRVARSAKEVQPVAVGERVPALKFRNLEGRDVTLASLWGENPIVLVFYRGGW